MQNDYVENHTYNISALINNSGTKDAGAFNVSLKINNNEVNKISINSLNIDSTKTVSFLWTPNTSGTYTIEIEVDSSNNIDE
ncbi:CARDB domain-containing protein [Methanothermococcus sp.]|uniref:CARDB domain-containing protein n=1 Tax=Methanothermococcus sp. TaxID=2614238 RepID=UPI0025D8F3F4|nr:CARDB domain-containing protein [Methanothermococcus sp.]